MTDPTTPVTFTVTTSRRAGDKLAITVVTDSGLKTTKVTARTYPFIVFSVGVWPSRWDAKTHGFVHEPNVKLFVRKGTGNRNVAERVFFDERAQGGPRHAAVMLKIGGPTGYKIEKATSNVEVAA